MGKMIPKIIYTCWLSDLGTMPEKIKMLVESQLRYHNDYQHVIIDYDKFSEIRSEVPAWVNKSYENGDYAHVSDYLRAYYLYNYGGIYLDSDVMQVPKQNIFDKYLDYEFFGNIEVSTNYYGVHDIMGDQYMYRTAKPIDLNRAAFQYSFRRDIEEHIPNAAERESFVKDQYDFIKSFKYGIAIDGAMFGAAKGCEVLGDVLDMQSSRMFEKYSDYGNIIKSVHYFPNICHIIAKCMEKYGFTYEYQYGKQYILNDGEYMLNTNRFISVTDYLNRENSRCELIHYCEGSWRDKE